jgi:ribosomal protein L7/L12
MPEQNQLPPAVIAALEKGNVIEAIKLLRDGTGLDLKQSKDTIDEHMRGNTSFSTPSTPAQPAALPPAVAQALAKGSKIEAIKLLREQTGMGLKEAKDAVESSGKWREPMAEGSPGEVPRSNSGLWLAVIIGAIIAAYFIF